MDFYEDATYHCTTCDYIVSGDDAEQCYIGGHTMDIVDDDIESVEDMIGR